MDPKISNLYSEYSNGRIDRRQFLKKLALLTGGTAAAYSLLPVLEGNQLHAAAPSEN